jgi:hypothetical protein
MSKLRDKLFLTGCDHKTEWQLPWFIENYWKHNSIPLAIADFGMSAEGKAKLTHPAVYCVMTLNDTGDVKGWFHKPTAMLNAPGRKVFWLDTDCEVLGNIERIFDYIEPNKLCMAIDKPWLKRRGELWHNSGVVGFEGRPEILKNWEKTVKESPIVGDQEVLHSMLNPITKITYIKDLPNEYNWLRVQLENDGEDSNKKKIMHWTGEKGNDRIKGKMKVMEALLG